MHVIIFILSLLLLPVFSIGQTYCTAQNKEKCETHLQFLANVEEEATIQEIAMQVGKRFLGTPYVGKTLEIDGKEKLVVELGGLDCTTFLENVVVFFSPGTQRAPEF